MATYRKGFDAPLSRYNTKRRELAASMLEYSEHMRQCNKARGAYMHPDKNDLGLPLDLEIRAHKQSLYRGEDVPYHSRRNNRHRKDHHHYDHERPLSFDEKELQRNRQPEYHERPRRDTKSERPIVIPNPGPDLPDTPEDNKQVKVSFVSASDLYDLVDLDNQAKNPNRSSTRIASLGDGVQIIQNLELSSRSKREEQDPFHLRRQADAGEMEEPPTRTKNQKTIDVDENSCLLTGRAIRKDVSRAKYRPKFNSSNRLSKENKTHELSPSDSKEEQDDPSLENNEVYSLDILLQDAASQHTASGTRLLLRPKRAKRMMLHQPDLLAIPEDGGSFIHSDNLASARNRMLTSVPQPSNSSWQALRGANAGNRRIDMDYEGDYDTRRTRKSRDAPIESDDRRTGRSHRKGRNDMNMNHLMATSVYSGLHWETEVEKKVAHDLSDRNSHKQKAQKKMKRLIFLRDQPEHHYRREM